MHFSIENLDIKDLSQATIDFIHEIYNNTLRTTVMHCSEEVPCDGNLYHIDNECASYDAQCGDSSSTIKLAAVSALVAITAGSLLYSYLNRSKKAEPAQDPFEHSQEHSAVEEVNAKKRLAPQTEVEKLEIWGWWPRKYGS